MTAICKQQVKLGKHFFLPNEDCQAIYSDDGKKVAVWLRGTKLATLPKAEFRKYFEEQGKK